MAIPNEQQTLELLKKEKQYPILIRADKNNTKYVTERVYINGVCIQIPVGEEVEVAETVYRALRNKGVI